MNCRCACLRRPLPPVIEAICADCAECHCHHSVPRRDDSYWPGVCDICGRPTIVADPASFGGIKTDSTMGGEQWKK